MLGEWVCLVEDAHLTPVEMIQRDRRERAKTALRRWCETNGEFGRQYLLVTIECRPVKLTKTTRVSQTDWQGLGRLGEVA